MSVRHTVLMIGAIAASSLAGPYSIPPVSMAAEPTRLDGLGFKAPGRTLSYSPSWATKRYTRSTKAKRKAAKLARRRNR